MVHLGYRAVFEQAEDGTWSAYVPELPIIAGGADTLEQLEADMRKGIDLWIEDMTLRGQTIPPPTALSEPPVFRTVDDLNKGKGPLILSFPE